MELGLHGRRAVVTGGRRGIGLATARALADEGVDVATCARERSWRRFYETDLMHNVRALEHLADELGSSPAGAARPRSSTSAPPASSTPKGTQP